MAQTLSMSEDHFCLWNFNEKPTELVTFISVRKRIFHRNFYCLEHTQKKNENNKSDRLVCNTQGENKDERKKTHRQKNKRIRSAKQKLRERKDEVSLELSTRLCDAHLGGDRFSPALSFTPTAHLIQYCPKFQWNLRCTHRHFCYRFASNSITSATKPIQSCFGLFSLSSVSYDERIKLFRRNSTNWEKFDSFAHH